jgi:Ser/Thr protein kinase RdoA (MazF antagonist)
MAITDADREPDLVAEVLEKHWRIWEPAVRTDLGVSRISWRVGQRYWLCQSEQRRSAALLSQAQLLQRLRCFLEDKHFSISIPEIVASESGDLIVAYGGYGWCLTRHLQGFHPDSGDPGIYPVLSEGLARFHHELCLFSEHQRADVPDGVCVKARQGIERLDDATFVPFTNHPEEQELMMRAGKWLLPRLARFELLPRQPIHGDWTPRNVLFDTSDNGAHLSAVLDFESMAYDPVHVDLANICSTLLMWSRLNRIEDRIDSVLSTYERFGGVRLERGDIYTAMLAHWFCHYWGWRDRIKGGGFGQDVKERLCLRVASVLDYVSGAAVGRYR